MLAYALEMSLQFNRSLLLAALIGATSFAIDHATAEDHRYDKCDSFKAHGAHLFHHTVMVVVMLGWASDSPVFVGLALLTLLIVLAHWETNGDKCWFNSYNNDVCQLPKDSRLRDLFTVMLEKMGLPPVPNKRSVHKAIMWGLVVLYLYRLKHLAKVVKGLHGKKVTTTSSKNLSSSLSTSPTSLASPTSLVSSKGSVKTQA